MKMDPASNILINVSTFNLFCIPTIFRMLLDAWIRH
jgi:hypothetical protein